jgi:phosphopantetheinyl transferase (holo-ACP synthase)
LFAEFDSVRRDLDAAGIEVLDAWNRVHDRPREASPPPPPAVGSPTRRAAVAGSMAGSTIESTRRLSVDDVPALVDHTFYRQPAGAALEDRFPVVPMTMTLEMMADAARAACPARLVVGLESVRALRWLAVAPPVEVAIRAEVEPGDDAHVTRVRVTIDGYARGVVVMADEWPEPPAPALGVRLGERPVEISPRAMYADRWMFHGPAYQGIVGLHGTGDDGIRGRLRALPAPGALLDAAGQLFGYWVMRATERDHVAFPMRIDSIRFHGPAPAPGDEVDCVVQIDRLTDADVAATLELVRDGRVWCRLDGWVDRRFESDDALFAVFQWPEKRSLGVELAPDVRLVEEPCHDSASRELLMRRYLTGTERAEYEALTPRAQRDWLVGRIAAKEVVRNWLWRHGADDLYPIEIEVAHDDRGRPVVTGPFDADLRVSIAHKDAVAVAAVAEGRDVGVDVETVEDRGARFGDLVLGADERALLEPIGDEPLARAWAAKEAAAKAAGTGLQGRPRDFIITSVTDDGLLVGGRPVTTTREGDFVVCWTTPDA